ncbi:DoxX family protein [Christiangramia salexigens]|uniref:DoxX family protein n=1 Tax=Christiangramia salexigens TaxID=1913577 RepID=A0A1L3J393_9FLAO|nr:DoxX family protein [Christiangramia salexigens]APG59582.1 DoxX family protein [Christiangramia salexigens]
MKNSYITNLNLRGVDLGLLIFRIGISALMLTHGVPKLIKFFGPEELTFGDPLGFGPEFTFTFAVLAEFVCAVFIIFGFLTRFAAIPLVITMAVAALIVHMPDGFGRQELPLLYFFGFLCIVFTGGGKYSLDFLISKRKK